MFLCLVMGWHPMPIQQLISGALLEAVKSDTETKNILKGLYRKLLLPMMRLYLFH